MHAACRLGQQRAVGYQNLELNDRVSAANQSIADRAWQGLTGYGHDPAITIRYIDTEFMIGQFVNDRDLAPSEAERIFGEH